jgi:CRP/FNR family cyclic AMP-dependent transcriptional regulator
MVVTTSGHINLGMPSRSEVPISNDLARHAVDLSTVLGEVFPQSRPDSRTALSSVATVRTFRPNEAILSQGDETSLVLVLGGHVALRRTTPDGRQLIVRIVDRGKLSGFLPLAARPAAHDAVALTPTPAAMWRSAEVRSLAKADAGLAIDLMDHILAAYQDVTSRLESLLYQDALRRVARVLHQHAELFFGDEPVLTRRQLPLLVGTSREMTGRVLRVLESRGVVARVGRFQFRLLDPAGLAAAVEAPEERRHRRTRENGQAS